MIYGIYSGISRLSGSLCSNLNCFSRLKSTRSSVDAEIHARRDIIRREEKYRQLVRALPLSSVLRRKISKSTRVTGDRLPFPLEFRNHIFSRLDTIPACDIHLSSQPSFDSNYALCISASRSKNDHHISQHDLEVFLLWD